jgi:hypothetical protein
MLISEPHPIALSRVRSRSLLRALDGDAEDAGVHRPTEARLDLVEYRLMSQLPVLPPALLRSPVVPGAELVRYRDYSMRTAAS